MVKRRRLRTFPKLAFTSSAEKLTARAGSLERPCTHSADLTGSVKGSYVMNRGIFKGLQGSHQPPKMVRELIREKLESLIFLQTSLAELTPPFSLRSAEELLMRFWTGDGRNSRASQHAYDQPPQSPPSTEPPTKKNSV
jgi:hypothetical protein